MAIDFAELQQLARRVGKQRELPRTFEAAIEGMRVLLDLAQLWDRLDEHHRDLLRVVVHSLGDDRKVPLLRRVRAGMQMMVLTSRHGVAEVGRLAANMLRARDELTSTVLAFEERNNALLQAALTQAVESSLDRSKRTPVAREKVGEWLKRLPS